MRTSFNFATTNMRLLYNFQSINLIFSEKYSLTKYISFNITFEQTMN